MELLLFGWATYDEEAEMHFNKKPTASLHRAKAMGNFIGLGQSGLRTICGHTEELRLS